MAGFLCVFNAGRILPGQLQSFPLGETFCRRVLSERSVFVLVSSEDTTLQRKPSSSNYSAVVLTVKSEETYLRLLPSDESGSMSGDEERGYTYSSEQVYGDKMCTSRIHFQS